MKKLLLLLFLFCGCEPIDKYDSYKRKNVPTTYIIDGCEYISWDRSITHKGNCTNQFHAK